MHIYYFFSKLIFIIIIGVYIFTLKKYLANKVKRIRSIIEAIISAIKTYLLRNCVYYSIIITYIIKYKVANTL